jgi:hypothetical protein
MCLFGTGVSAIAIQVNDTTFFTDCPLITPTIFKIREIRECSLAIKITNITAPDKNGLVTNLGATSFLTVP